jgi:cytochrome P450
VCASYPHALVAKRGQIAKDIIASRSLPRPEQSTDMLDSFLRHGLSTVEAESEIAIGLVAGSDTTSTGLRATLLAIISNPTVYHKLQTEIDNAILSERISAPIKDSEARQLPYLQACIYEGLRCHPPLVMPRERLVPSEGDVVCGYKSQGGTSVGVNVWSSQRNEIFGSDPEIFRPGRWMDADKEEVKAMVKVWELIFGHGTTKCLGQNLAMMTMNKFFPEVCTDSDLSRIMLLITSPTASPPVRRFHY